MTDLRSLKTLQWVKQRRLAEIERQVQVCNAQWAASSAELATATQRHEVCAGEELSCSAKISALGLSPAFRPEVVVTLGHVLSGLAALTREAAQVMAQAASQHDEALQRLAAARRALQRAERQRDQLAERVARRLKEIDQEGEDTQDEESEEAAVARRVAQRNAQRQQAVQVCA